MFCKAVLIAVLLAGIQGENATADEILQAETALRQDLLRNYDKTAMPRRNTKVTIIEVSVQNIKMREDDQVMEVLTRLSLLWDDPRLIWDLKSHQDVGFLGMDPESIWTPDLAVYNGAEHSHVPRSSLPMLVYPKDGTILYTSPYNLKFMCPMDLTYWPHDFHNCTLKLGSWVHQGHLLDLFLKDNKVEMEIPSGLTSNGINISTSEWSIVETSVHRETFHLSCCQESLVTVLLAIGVQRNAPVYSWTIKLPVVCLSILTGLLFLLPPAAGEKLLIGGLCLIGDLIYISVTSRVIAHAPSHTPLIVQLICQQVPLVTLSLIVSAFTVRMSRDHRSKGLPFFMRKGLVMVSYPLCLRSYRNLLTYTTRTFEYNMRSDNTDYEGGRAGVEEDQPRKLSLDGCEWLFLSAVIDRLAFFLYAAICFISLIRYSSVL